MALHSILVPTDFSPHSEAAAARAVSLVDPAAGSIHLLHAMRFPRLATPYEISVPGAVWEGVREGAEQKLEAARRSLQEATTAAVTAQLSDATQPVDAMAECVGERGIELVVMGTHGHGGLRRAFLGSVTERALRSLDVPVLAVKEEAHEASRPITRITVATDFSAHSERAVQLAATLAEGLGAAVDVVHALQLPTDYSPYSSAFGGELIKQIQDEVDSRLEAVRQELERRGIAVETYCRRGVASAVIGELAGQGRSQLVVMGTRGASGLAHVLLGSVAERTIRTAPCSVLAVKAADEPGR